MSSLATSANFNYNWVDSDKEVTASPYAIDTTQFSNNTQENYRWPISGQPDMDTLTHINSVLLTPDEAEWITQLPGHSNDAKYDDIAQRRKFLALVRPVWIALSAVTVATAALLWSGFTPWAEAYAAPQCASDEWGNRRGTQKQIIQASQAVSKATNAIAQLEREAKLIDSHYKPAADRVINTYRNQLAKYQHNLDQNIKRQNTAKAKQEWNLANTYWLNVAKIKKSMSWIQTKVNEQQTAIRDWQARKRQILQVEIPHARRAKLQAKRHLTTLQQVDPRKQQLCLSLNQQRTSWDVYNTYRRFPSQGTAINWRHWYWVRRNQTGYNTWTFYAEKGINRWNLSLTTKAKLALDPSMQRVNTQLWLELWIWDFGTLWAWASNHDSAWWITYTKTIVRNSARWLMNVTASVRYNKHNGQASGNVSYEYNF